LLEYPLFFIGWQQTLLHSHAYNFSTTTANEVSKISLKTKRNKENKLSKFHHKIHSTIEVIASQIFGSLHFSMYTPLMAISHYSQTSRGRRFPPMRLQETKNLASRPFALKGKVQWPLSYMAIFFYPNFDKSDKLSKKFWMGLK